MSIIIQVNLPIPNPVVTEEFVQFRQVSGLHMFKLHRHLVEDKNTNNGPQKTKIEQHERVHTSNKENGTD
jgi:hypothetical protein